jgi:hypothetical protein
LHHNVQIGSGAHPASCPVGTGVLSVEVKRPGRETDRSLPSAEVKSAWSYTFTHPYVYMTWCFAKDRDNFTFILPSFIYLFLRLLFFLNDFLFLFRSSFLSFCNYFFTYMCLSLFRSLFCIITSLFLCFLLCHSNSSFLSRCLCLYRYINNSSRPACLLPMMHCAVMSPHPTARPSSSQNKAVSR